MSWTPRETTTTFAKTRPFGRTIRNFSEIQFKIFGKVVKQFVVTPERNWHAGHVTDVQEGQMLGTLGSPVDPDFKIVFVECPNPHIKIVQRKLTPKECMRGKL